MSTPFYDLASLVVVPSGYKSGKVYAQKPQTTDGQLTFTRASSASRVASNGLIEKVRTNLVPNGLSFIASTGVAYATITSDSPISGVSSTRITKNQAAGTLQYGNQTCSTATIASNTIHTLSRFFKYDGFNTTTSIESNNGLQWSATFVQNIDIASTGITLQAPNNCTSKITNVGNGWYRVDVTVSVGTVTVGGPVTYLLKVASALSTGQGFLTAAPQLEVSDFGATDYILTTSAAVSVGPVSGLPRLDYLNSTCPRLILEGQRTNLVTFSENFNDASYSKTEMTVTANAAISPDGTQNADKLVPSTNASNHFLTKSMTFSGAGALSVYAKADGYNYLILLNSSGNVSFNLSNGTATTDGSIVSVGNGWYRCTFTKTFANGTMYLSCGSSSVPAFFNGAGDGTSGVLLYGFQLEAGAYATSYIPTLGASVTRVADAASKTGISSLIGQTEGTILIDMEFKALSTNRDIIYIGTSAQAYRLVAAIGNSINAGARVSSSTVNYVTSSALTNGRIKIAFGYKSGDHVLYINGVQIGTSTSTSVPTGTISEIQLGTAIINETISNPINQALLFKTRLTNAQLAELTAL